MDLASRLREAIKQTHIVIEETDHSDVHQTLKAGLERLEKGLESLETSDEK
jgi:PleD family two-component response regulator